MTTRPAWMPYSINEASALFEIERTTVQQTIAPVMGKGGYAYKSGSSWWFHPEYTPQWAAFFEARKALIESGYWKPKRSHSIDDFEKWFHGDLDDVMEVKSLLNDSIKKIEDALSPDRGNKE